MSRARSLQDRCTRTRAKRLPGILKDVPTWKELGADAVVAQWRILIGPKGMTPAQVAYWESVFRRLMDVDEWKKELDETPVSPVRSADAPRR